MTRVAVVGYLSIDTITTPSGHWTDQPGGAALYAALAARSMGAQVSLFTTAGADFPRSVLDQVAALGINIGAVTPSPTPSRRADMRYDADGSRASVTFDAAAWWAQTMALQPPLLPAEAAFDVVVINPMPPARAAAQIDRAGHSRIVLDASEGFARRDRDAILALVRRVSIFAPSREETRLLLPGLSDDAAALTLAANCSVVQKRGADGAFVVSARAHAGARIAAPPATVVDPTGAGDTVVGALAAALARGEALESAAHDALALAARAISAPGLGALMRSSG